MSSLASKNAFRGYSFQFQVFLLFLIKMDYDRDILKIKAENIVENHNFDDLILDTKNNQIFIQVKNMNVDKEHIKIEKDYVNINNVKIQYKSDIKNLLIVKDIEIESNTEFMGLPCYNEDNIYICSLNTYEIFDIIDNINLDDKRFSQLARILSFISSSSCEICIKDLPKFNFYNIELKEKTLNIRKELLDFKTKAVNFVIGKPGIGKSHFVNELHINNSILYRFWIGENDVSKNERLQYPNFIKDISYKLFDCSHVKEEIEIINKIKEDNKILIIDGLDHVENYNSPEIEKYFSFITMLEENNVHSIILSRPLKHEINGNVIELSNWNKSQTKEYINKKYNITSYDLEEYIFNISKGYPIIVDFLCKEFIANNKIRDFPEINDLATYYDTLIHETDINTLYVFSKCRCFLIKEELKDLFDDYSLSVFMGFIHGNSFLFNIDRDRISLIHDSLNLYLRTKLPQLTTFDEKLQTYVSKSLLNNEIRFFSRFQSFELDKDKKREILKKYLNINIFKKILYGNLDYESIRNFYKIMPDEMSKFSPDDFTELEYLQLSIIENIVARNNIEQNFDLLIPLFKYLEVNKPENYNTSIYSSETLYFLQNFNIKEYQNYIDAEFYDTNTVLNSYYDAYCNYEMFLKSKDIKYIDVSKLCFDNSKMGDYWRVEEVSNLLCQLFLTNNNFLHAVDFVTCCATDNPSYYPMAIEILNFVKLDPYQFNIDRLKHLVKDTIFQYDKFNDINYYEHKTLKQIILEHAHEGSFCLNSYICSCLNHAILCNKIIDIESISLYWGMFYQRKDYSLDDIQTIMNIFKNKDYIKLQDCCNIINTCQEMTEKSYRYNFNEFLNNLSDDEIKLFIATNNLDDYRIIISQLNPNIINILPNDFVYREVADIILGRNPYNIHTTIEYNDIDKILKSNYKDEIVNLIRQNNITITNAPQGFQLENINIIYNKEEYIIGSQFEKGYAYYKDVDYIKENNISHINLSKMIDGYLYRLPYASLFYHFDRTQIVLDIKKIFYNSLCLNNYRYFDFYLYNMSIVSIIELFEHFNININWNEVFEIIMTYLNISLVLTL